MGGLRASLGSEGSVRDLFCMFVCGCERLFAHQGSVFDFGRALWRMGRGTSQLQRSIEFMEISSSRGIPGRSLSHVFPLPSFVTEEGVSRFHFGRMPATHDERVGHGVNILQAALNMLYGGGQARVQSVLTAAHKRIQARLQKGVQSMMVEEPLLGKKETLEFLKHQQHYVGGGVAIPLGNRGGVPDQAAQVDLAGALETMFPSLAMQVKEPKVLLLPSRRRPIRIKRGHTWLHSTYPELVRRNVAAGLHVLKKSKQVARHRGKYVLAGAFAVKKDDVEDRVITDPAVNQLLDPALLPRPRFAYIPKMRTLWVPKVGKLLISKRDARHYFHTLRIGNKWHKWLCGPPIRSNSGDEKYPACAAAPMGFGPSAGWAQALTDVATAHAQLPDHRRLHPDSPCPMDLPLWGSICDDIWWLDHVYAGQHATGPERLAAAEEAWKAHGVTAHKKKSVDAEGDTEIQGYHISSDDHWVGVSLRKRYNLFEATVFVLQQHTVVVKDIERLVGKYGFCHSARPPARSLFEVVYPWLQQQRAARKQCAVLPDSVWIELMLAALFLPFYQFDVSAPFSTRVECTDASMTGLGRAWATMPTEIVQEMARLTDAAKVYTNLQLPWGIGLTEEQKCPLRRLKLPVHKVFWHKAGSRSFPSQIFLGEADACVWAAADRLRRPQDDDSRFVHPLDSATCVGAFMKGRSPSRLLNRRCRKLFAIGVSGGHEVFYPWIPSGDNPADDPSRWFEVGAEASWKEAQPEPSEEIVMNPVTLRGWTGGERFFVHLCSGPITHCDIVSEFERLSSEQGLNIQGLRIDPLVGLGNIQWPFVEAPDLLFPTHGQWLLSFIQSGRVIAGFASPPYAVFSPLVFQHTAFPTNGLQKTSMRRSHDNMVRAILYLICVGLLGEMRAKGAWCGFAHRLGRHQQNPQSKSGSRMLNQLQRFAKLHRFDLDPCLYGSQCRHGVALYVSGCQILRTKQFAPAPLPLGATLARHCIQRVLTAQNYGYTMPFKPLHAHSRGLDPWRGELSTAWDWPQPRGKFLDVCIERVNAASLSKRIGTAQQ